MTYGPQDDMPAESAHPSSRSSPTSPSSSDRSVAIFAHLSTLIAAVLSVGSLSILGPLVLWLIYKDKNPFVRQAAAGAFNFAAATWVASILVVLLAISIIGIVAAVPLGIFVAIAVVIFPILGAVKANDGLPYRYPLRLPILT